MSGISNPDGSGSFCYQGGGCDYWDANGNPVDNAGNPIDNSPSGFTRGTFDWKKAIGLVLIVVLIGYLIKPNWYA